MADAYGYMEYDFASLKKIRIVEPREAQSIFLNCCYLKGELAFKGMLEFADIEQILVDDSYFVMNNESRRKGSIILFTGNVVEAHKDDIWSFISKPIQNHNLIVPLMIVPLTYDSQPGYMLTTQEDPIFKWFVTNEQRSG